jgi:hypothetical protein
MFALVCLLKDFDELPKNIDLFKSFHPGSIRFSELPNDVTLSRQVDKYRTLLLIICIAQSK